MSKYRLTEKKFISKYLAQHFIGEEASEDECDKEAEFILEYITQSLLATVTPEKLKEEIARIWCCFAKDDEETGRIKSKSCAECPQSRLEKFKFPNCFFDIAEGTQKTLDLLQRSTAQAVQEAVINAKKEERERIAVKLSLKDICPPKGFCDTKFRGDCAKCWEQALKEEG